MTYAIVYSSNTGNTKLLAERIRKNLGEKDCRYFGDGKELPKDADVYFIGFWTDKGTCSETFKKVIHNLHHKKIILFGTAGFGQSSSYFETILSHVKEELPQDCEVVAGYMCQGKMPETVRKRYEEMLEQKPEDAKILSFLANFDEARNHPDVNDLQNLDAFVRNVWKSLQ